jgi:hypothetical protein
MKWLCGLMFVLALPQMARADAKADFCKSVENDALYLVVDWFNLQPSPIIQETHKLRQFTSKESDFYCREKIGLNVATHFRDRLYGMCAKMYEADIPKYTNPDAETVKVFAKLPYWLDAIDKQCHW